MNHVRALAGAMALCLVVLFAAACSDPAAGALNVNDVKSDPAAFTGEIRIAGVMGAVHPRDPRIIGIMDKAELTCTSANCNKFYLPVHYEGERPAIGDEVLLTGSFTQGGQLFAATAVKVLRNHKL